MDFAHEYRLRHSVGSTIPSDVAIVAGNGWFHIIQNAANKLAALGLSNLVSISITHVAAVDGGLLIDTNVDEVAATRAIRNAAASICAQADDEAHGQCESCGGPWRSVKAGMTWRMRCDDCEVR